MQATSFEEALDLILIAEKRYHRDAYLFLRDALEHTRQMIAREQKEKLIKPRRTSVKHVDQHVSGQQLLAGIREYALLTFGPMAITVLAEWNVHKCEDFGELVFIMVENRLLKKTENDSRADFENGYDFNEAFRKPFLPKDQPAKPSGETKVTSK